MGGVVGLVQSARATFQALPESADMEQRVRAGIDALARDLIMAGAGSKHGSADPCNDDVSLWPDHGSAISIVYVPRAQTTPVTHTYYLDTDSNDARLRAHTRGREPHQDPGRRSRRQPAVRVLRRRFGATRCVGL
jgi:hypothetical protein